MTSTYLLWSLIISFSSFGARKEEELFSSINMTKEQSKPVAFNHILQRWQWFHCGWESHNPWSTCRPNKRVVSVCKYRRMVYTEQRTLIDWDENCSSQVLNSVYHLEWIEIRTAKMNWGPTWVPVHLLCTVNWNLQKASSGHFCRFMSILLWDLYSSTNSIV